MSGIRTRFLLFEGAHWLSRRTLGWGLPGGLGGLGGLGLGRGLGLDGFQTFHTPPQGAPPSARRQAPSDCSSASQPVPLPVVQSTFAPKLAQA
jgi:hypothetical protein